MNGVAEELGKKSIYENVVTSKDIEVRLSERLPRMSSSSTSKKLPIPLLVFICSLQCYTQGLIWSLHKESVDAYGSTGTGRSSTEIMDRATEMQC
jgi:hypothetical protein